MEKNNNLEFKCTQFLNFNRVDEEDSQLEAYFDHNVSDKGLSEARSRSLYKFTASYTKPKLPSVKDEKENPFAIQAKKSLRKSRVSTIAPSIMGRPSRFRPSVRMAVKNPCKPISVAKPATKLLVKPLVGPIAPLQERQRPVSPTQMAAVHSIPPPRPRVTRPMTPQCLKRSLTKSKVVKSSEELELERIAEMRRKMKTDLDLNKATMKRVRAPALRPLPERRFRPPVAVAETGSSKNNLYLQREKKVDATFKKPAMVTKAKSAIGFDSKHTVPKTPMEQIPKTPYNLRLDRRLSRSESSLSSISRLNGSSNRTTVKSLNVCHSGVKFIPKQDRKLCASTATSGPSNNENKTFTWKTPRKVQDEVPRMSLMKKDFALPKNKPFRDRTNLMSSKLFPLKQGLKRLNSICLTDERCDKRKKTVEH